MQQSEAPLGIVILGGSRGIGRAIVERALAEGHRVFAGARGAADLAVLERSQAASGRLLTRVVDVAEDDSLRAFYMDARARLGGIDVVINNAAREGYGKLSELEPETIESIVRTNLMGVVLSCRHAIEAMRPRGGHIINIGSEVAYRAVPFKSIYSATKFAVRGFSDALEIELAPLGIRVSQVHPGFVDTSLHDEELRRTGTVARPHDGGSSSERVAARVAALWHRRRSSRVVSLRALARSVVGELFPAWARWRTRRAFPSGT